MSNLEPIEEKDLDLEHKFKSLEPQSFEIPEKKEAVEKEAPSEIIAAEKDDAYAKILSKVTKVAPVDTGEEDVKSDAEKTHQKTDAESQIQNLVDIALAKGVVHAVKVAKHLESNYVLDMFHDKMLSDELHNALLEKGLIQDI
jgi:hypothetical protein